MIVSSRPHPGTRQTTAREAGPWWSSSWDQRTPNGPRKGRIITTATHTETRVRPHATAQPHVGAANPRPASPRTYDPDVLWDTALGHIIYLEPLDDTRGAHRDWLAVAGAELRDIEGELDHRDPRGKVYGHAIELLARQLRTAARAAGTTHDWSDYVAGADDGWLIYSAPWQGPVVDAWRANLTPIEGLDDALQLHRVRRLLGDNETDQVREGYRGTRRPLRPGHRAARQQAPPIADMLFPTCSPGLLPPDIQTGFFNIGLGAADGCPNAGPPAPFRFCHENLVVNTPTFVPTYETLRAGRARLRWRLIRLVAQPWN